MAGWLHVIGYVADVGLRFCDTIIPPIHLFYRVLQNLISYARLLEKDSISGESRSAPLPSSLFAFEM